MHLAPELVEDTRSMREELWRMARYAQDAAETLDARITDEDLNGRAEAVEIREGLERLHALSLEANPSIETLFSRWHPPLRPCRGQLSYQ